MNPRPPMDRGRLPVLLLVLVASLPLQAADWPMDRHDAGRTSSSPQELARSLSPQWVRELPPLKPAWPDQPAMQFDSAYNPIVVGKTLLLASPRQDSVLALDTETGAERWKFITDGPVRFAPVAWEGKVYFTSDDGHLYCLDAARGNLVWKFRGGPSDRRVLGNDRLISAWPARGGPVLADGTVYFAASIWPFMGIFVHALDARSGRVVWTNDGDGAIYIPQPHQADSFAGVAPQGALVVAGDRLLLPGGRSVPACLDRATGKLVHYRLADNSKIGGGSEVSALGNLVFNGGASFDLADGDYLGSCGRQVVLTPNALYSAEGNEVRAYDWPDTTPASTVDRRGRTVVNASWNLSARGSHTVQGVASLIRAGSRLYAGAHHRVIALDLPLRANAPLAWETAIEGDAVRLLAADDRLFVVTREGRLHCFGPRATTERVHNLSNPIPPAADDWTRKARKLLETSRVREGYCIAWGIGSGRLITELARQSRLHVVAIDPDARRVNAFRKTLIESGLYGERVAVHVGTPETFALPPYLASLMVSEELAGTGSGPAFLERVFSALRPQGGVACLPFPAGARSELRKLVRSRLVGARVRETEDWFLLVREGALPGSADWTHEHADAANSRVSRDRIVKAPLGLLWFGGPSHQGILPRHGHGPQPQVIAGRVLIEGVDMLRALDLYTGRLLWETELPGVGKAFDNTAHQPGANASGSNFVSTPEGVYIVHDNACLRLDLNSGKVVSRFPLPDLAGERESARWSYLNVSGEYLVGGANVLEGNPRARDALSSSKCLFVLNRSTGKLLWSATARSGFRHNAVCIGGGKLFVVDRPSADHLARLKRRGETMETRPRLLALDLASGKELWSSEEAVFGTWLSYSAKHDVLVEAGLVSRDTLADEAGGIRAWMASKGRVLWHHPEYSGPAMIHGDQILKNRGACDLLTGAARMRTDPLTGLPVEWTWARNYGCNTPMASEHLLTFRSGAAGFFDLCNDGGTGNLGGFRSSCTNNLVVAGGVLVAPDYTRTCTCSYQNQTSIALVPMPEAELWTFQGSRSVQGPVRRVGINLGAPGDRKSSEGTLWLEYPSVGGPSPTLAIRHTGNVEWFRRHSSRVESGEQPWVAASGARGLESLTIPLDRSGSVERVFTVRLHFLEPDPVRAGQRLMDVTVQGRSVLQKLDICREAGGSQRGLVREFRDVRISGELTIGLHPSAGSPLRETILCGVEVMEQGR